MAQLTRAVLESEVLEKIAEEILDQIKNYVREKESGIVFWGVNKERPGFCSFMVLLTLYKDLYGVGYNKIKRRLPRTFHMSNDSLSFNVCQMRCVLGNWGLEKMTLGTRTSWLRGAKLIRLDNVPPEEKTGAHVHFLLHSVDFKIRGRNRRIAGSSTEYSWKEKHQAQRYQVLTNTRGIVKRVWGLHSPKTYDGDWLKLMAENFSESLTGAVILADGHYSWGRDKDNIPGVRFLVAYPKNLVVEESESSRTSPPTPSVVLWARKGTTTTKFWKGSEVGLSPPLAWSNKNGEHFPVSFLTRRSNSIEHSLFLTKQRLKSSEFFFFLNK